MQQDCHMVVPCNPFSSLVNAQHHDFHARLDHFEKKLRL